MDEKELLRTVPLFSELSDADIASLARLAARRNYPKDTVVFFENEEGDFFFMIVAGRIKVTILGDDGREIILSMLGPGDFFGEMALLDNEPRSATAIAVEESELLSLHRTDFQSVIGDNPAISNALIKVLTARLRRANHQISTLALLDVYGRVARVILDMAQRGGAAAQGRAHRLPPRHAPGDRQPHRHHARDRDAHAEGPGAPGPRQGRRPRARAAAGLRARLRLVRPLDPDPRRGARARPWEPRAAAGRR